MSRFADALERARITPSPERGDRRANRVFVPSRPHSHLSERAQRGRVEAPRTDPEVPPAQPPSRSEADSPARFDWQANDTPERRHANIQYHQLAAALHEAQRERGLAVVLVASAMPREGKTSTAAHLAVTLSDACQRRALVIDADLRRPSLHEVFGVPNQAGLNESLSSGTLRTSSQTARLSLLTSGRIGTNPLQTLTSDGMRSVIERARQQFDWVIVDTPPVTLLPDARLLAAMADGVLLVVRAGVTPYPLVQRAAESIGRERILGVVLNGVTERGWSESYGGYGYGYGYGHADR